MLVCSELILDFCDVFMVNVIKQILSYEFRLQQDT